MRALLGLAVVGLVLASLLIGLFVRRVLRATTDRRLRIITARLVAEQRADAATRATLKAMRRLARQPPDRPDW